MQRTLQQTRRSPSRSKLSSARIASLLPSFTDIVTELGESPCLVAVTHECAVQGRVPCVTNSKISVDGLESTQIAAGWNTAFSLQHSVEELLTTHTCSFYHINVLSLVRTKPTVVLTHLKPPKTELDPSEEELKSALQSVIPGLVVLSANPTSLMEISNLYQDIGRLFCSPARAVACIAAAELALQDIHLAVNKEMPDTRERPCVSVVQWTSPLYLAGDWVPSAVEISGRLDNFVKPGSPSVCVEPRSFREVDIVIFALCALSIEKSEPMVRRFYEMNEDLPDPLSVKYIICDATTLFSRPTLSNVVKTAKMVAEIVMDNSQFGMKGKLWREWRP
ncbi:hypothetical protein FGB62_7g439 [Gracilaria domingensis]|nr:hypothetical protein FGB62_7g439 [Gracilaria domingensis]